MRASSAERLVVEGRWLARFRQMGLTAVRSFLELPGEIVSGHSDRQVVRVRLQADAELKTAYLKREHRVRLRDRLASWWARCGFVSLAGREARNLTVLREAGVPVPKPLAWGESGGRAFLLLRAAAGSMELRSFLRRTAVALPDHRRASLACRLGEALAGVHKAGFDAPDLLSKHILIHPRRLRLTLLDWPRARRSSRVPVAVSARDLARLHSSLAPELATAWDRLRCLRAYWRGRGGVTFCAFRELFRAIRRATPAALARRSVRELLQSPMAGPRQWLRWLEGESLVVTRKFARECNGQWPTWLTTAALATTHDERIEQVFWNDRRTNLHRWPAAAPVQRCLAWLRGRRVETGCTRQAGLLFRLERYGVRVPRVLAFGRRIDGAGFLLTQPSRESRPITDWLRLRSPQRFNVIRRFGSMLARVHDAGVQIGRNIASLHVRAGGQPILTSVRDLKTMPRCAGRWPLSDLAAVLSALGLTGRDAAECVRGYLGNEATTHDGRKLAESLRGELPEPREPNRA